MSAMTAGWMVSAGPQPMPLSTQAPIKLPYVCALARHIVEAKVMSWLRMKTGRRPYDVLNGTLEWLLAVTVHSHEHEHGAYHIKLLKPRTKIATP